MNEPFESKMWIKFYIDYFRSYYLITQRQRIVERVYEAVNGADRLCQVLWPLYRHRQQDKERLSGISDLLWLAISGIASTRCFRWYKKMYNET